MGWLALFFGVMDVFFMLFASIPSDDIGFYMFMIILCSVGFAFCLWLYVKGQKLKNQRKQHEEHQKKVAFYNECVEKGVNSCDSEKEIQKATLIAQKMGLAFTDVAVLFDETQKCKKSETDAAIEATREKKRNEEFQKYALLTQYANYSGREKRVAMLTDEYQRLIEAAKTLESGAMALLLASQRKEEEGSWATIGGAVSGLAGPAAGMAAALDAQARTAQENAQIRARNQSNLKLVAPTLSTSYGGASERRAAAQKIAEEIEAAKIKLIADDSLEDCFKRVHFQEATVSISETGTCTVMTTISVDPFTIFDNIPAVIDGTVLAQIYDGDQLVGTAEMVLPTYGLGGGEELLTGMSLFCGHAGASYRVEFSPRALWAMEK